MVVAEQLSVMVSFSTLLKFCALALAVSCGLDELVYGFPGRNSTIRAASHHKDRHCMKDLSRRGDQAASPALNTYTQRLHFLKYSSSGKLVIDYHIL